MSHHSDQPFFSQEQLNEWAKNHKADEFTKNMPADQADRLNKIINEDALKVAGATGNFPDGKLTETDEGEIKFAITAIEDRVVVNFGTPVHWVGFTRAQALAVANSLTKHAATIPAK